MKNVDLLLQSLMSKHKTSAQRRVSAGEPEADAPAPTFAVLVRFTGDVEELRAAGLVTGLILKHPREPFSIATGTIPMERIAELAAIPHVEQIEGPRTFRSELNKSVPEIGAKILHEQIPTPYKGQGVVIGIIDTGFDFRHEAFRKQDGTTRVLAIWDQLLEKQDKEKTLSLIHI